MSSLVKNNFGNLFEADEFFECWYLNMLISKYKI